MHLKGMVCKHIIENPPVTKCASFLADLFLNSYETNFMQGLFLVNDKNIYSLYVPLHRRFPFTGKFKVW